MPVDVEAILKNAADSLRAGKPDAAAQLASEALGLEPQSSKANLIAGLAAAHRGQRLAAIEWLRQAFRLDPSNGEAARWLSNLLRMSGDLAEAVEFGHRAVALDPLNADGHSILGLSLLANGQPVAAEETFGAATRLQPDMAVHHHNRGQALQRQQRDEAAIESYRRATQLDPSVPASWISLATLLQKAGDRAGAITAFRRAHKLEPNTVRGRIQLAQALIEERDYKAAESVLRELCATGAGTGDPQHLLSRLYQRLGRFDEAAACLEKIITAQPDKARAHFDLLYGRKVAGDDSALVERAADLLKRREPSQGDRALLHYALGKSYDDLGDYRVAMTHFDAANEIMLGKLVDRPFQPERHAAYFDELIRIFDRAFIDRHSHIGSQSDLPVLIVGMIRSGTTLVEQIVSNHPQVGAGGELTFLPSHLRELFDAQTHAPDEARCAETIEGYLRLLASLAPGKLRVTDKMPHNYASLGAIHLLFPNARIIHCRRNPVDTCLSVYTTPYHGPISYGHKRENIAFYYRQYRRLMAHWRSVLPASRFLEVDYEDVIANQEEVTRKLVCFLGLPWDDACLHFERNVAAVKTPSLWQARQPIYKTSVERWRRYEPWLGALANLQSSDLE